MLALALAVAGALAAYLVLRRQPPPTVRGSPTVEFTPKPPPAPPKQPGVFWPTYGYDPQRTRAVASRLRPPFKRLWTFHGRALLEFPPVVGYGRVYVTNFGGRLFSLDARTGRARWTYRSYRCGWASPALAAHVVYETFIGNAECHSRFRDGELVALSALSGRLLWLRKLGPTESSPLVANGDVYVGDWTGRIYAYDARTGRVRWTADTDGAVKGSIALAGNRLYVGTYAGSVYSLDARSGRRLWRDGGHGSLYSSPAVAYDRVYIGSLDGGVYAFGASTGTLRWSEPTGGYVYASPAVWHGLVLVGSYDHDFYAFDAATGAVRWRFRADAPISGAASVIGDIVYFSSFDERTYALAAASGRLLATWPDGKYSPAVSDPKHLYLVGLGRLYALGER